MAGAAREAEKLPLDAVRQLSARRRCIRCGTWYTEFDNMGRLKCRQKYFLYGRKYVVAADHMPTRPEDAHKRAVRGYDLRQRWTEFVYGEDDDIVLNEVYTHVLPEPDPRAVVAPAPAERRSGERTLGFFVQDQRMAGCSESAPERQYAFDMDNRVCSDDELQSDSDEDGFADGAGYGGSSSSAASPCPVQTCRWRRFDWNTCEYYRRTLWPAAREEYMAASTSVRKVPFYTTELYKTNHIAAASHYHGIGPPPHMYSYEEYYLRGLDGGASEE